MAKYHCDKRTLRMVGLQQLSPFYNPSLNSAPAVLFLLAAIAGQLVAVRKLKLPAAWKLARIVSSIALLFSLICSVDAFLHTPSLAHGSAFFSLGGFPPLRLSFRFDVIEALMLLLVTFLGWVIIRYSQHYMAGDGKQGQYLRNLMLTLTSVSLLVVTNNLLLFLCAWILTSLSLHELLTLYPDRQPAMVAAHKKFIASRLGDLMLLCGFVLLGLQAGSFEMDQVFQQLAEAQPVSTSVHVAIVLIAVAAIIKCAQLPLHGWLIQVMEAPTPVSALLHAGIVNLGGFMLIRLAPIINTTPAAQNMLVMVGCTSAVLASLVATTRISIKVHLAWSTCAQMGFMLMECGLGLYGLALLHLLAHSLYKAHEFLESGSTVSHTKFRAALAQKPAIGSAAAIVGGCGGLFLAAFGEYLWRSSGGMDLAALFCVTIVGLAIAVIITAISRARGFAESLIFLGRALLVSILYFGYDRLFQRLLPDSTVHLSQHTTALVFAMACFVLLYTIQTTIRVRPAGRFTTRIYRWFYAGFYVDEIFTRFTFHFWPVKQCKENRPRRDVAQFFDAEGAN